MDYYSVLGVQRNATPDDIKKAYRRLASKHHPDKGGDHATFQNIQAAYATLSDPQKRQQYDSPQPQGFHFNVNTGNMDEIFGDMFRQFGFNPFHPGGPRPAAKNRDTRIEIGVLLEETLADQTKIVSIKTASGERTNVDITIPRGINTGTTIKYPSLGDDSQTGLPRGDLYVTIHIQPHAQFQPQGLDLIQPLTIDSFDAMLGCEREIETLDHKRFNVKIPAGCQPGTKLKIAGEGLFGFRADVRGHMYIMINVRTPSDLTDHQRTLIRSAKEWQQ